MYFMAKKKITIESLSVDHDTGEVVSSMKQFVSVSSTDKFLFMNFNNGLDDLVRLGVGLRLLLFIDMLENERLVRGIYYSVYGSVHIGLFSDSMGVSVSSVRKAMSSLVKLGYIIKVRNGLYLLNPSLLYKGGTSSLSKKVSSWNDAISDQEDDVSYEL